MAVAAAAVGGKRSHPKGLPVLFLTEMWERFSFYTMLAIFALYMITPKEDGGLQLGTFWTTQIYGLYIGLVYFSPLVGGFLADRFLGIKRSVVIGGFVMMLGHFLLAFRPLPFFFSALVCLIIGNGLFKPNISTMLGHLYREVPERRDDGYNIFYMGINLGAFFSPLVASTLRALDPIHGWHYAFAAAGFGMIFSVIIFLTLQRFVKAGDIPPQSRRKPEDTAAYPVEAIDPGKARRRTGALLIIFLVVIFFWMAFNQQGLTLTFWANRVTRTTLLPETFQSVNPAFILLLTFPLLTFWSFLRARGKEPSTAAKIGIGMLLTAAAFTIMGVGSLVGGDSGKMNVGWLLATYGTITIGELCLSPMGLSLVSKLAPPGRVGTMMGAWFAFTAAGGYLAGLVGGLWNILDHSAFFFLLVGTSLLAALGLFLLLKKLDPVIHEAEQEAERGHPAGAAEAAKAGPTTRQLLTTGAILFLAAGFISIYVTLSKQDRIAEVVDANEVRLRRGRTVHLIGLAPWPKEALPDSLAAASPGDTTAAAAVPRDLLAEAEALEDHSPVRLEYLPGFPQDSISVDLFAYLRLKDGTDLNAELIRRGLAAVDPEHVHPRRADYLALERSAREEGRGLWRTAPPSESGPAADRVEE